MTNGVGPADDGETLSARDAGTMGPPSRCVGPLSRKRKRPPRTMSSAQHAHPHRTFALRDATIRGADATTRHVDRMAVTLGAPQLFHPLCRTLRSSKSLPHVLAAELFSRSAAPPGPRS